MTAHSATAAKAKIIDGTALAAAVKADIKRRATALRAANRPPRLDAVLVTSPGTAGSAIYARNQAAACHELGIEHRLHRLPADATYEDIAGRILLLNADDDVRAIMLHLPLPESVATGDSDSGGSGGTERIQSLIAVEKDVEGVNPANIGNIVYGRRSLVPCTALAVMEMIESTGISLPGKVCVVVGASNIVGKPIAVLLMRAEATVISTNIYTTDLKEWTHRADVLISAVGKPGLISAGMVKRGHPGAVVIDVGITRMKDDQGNTRTVGDVLFDEVSQVAGHISPVPGGVGPMTVAMLLRNTVQAAEM